MSMGNIPATEAAVFGGCRVPFQVNCESNSSDTFTLAKFLSNGDIAVAMFNMWDISTKVARDFYDM